MGLADELKTLQELHEKGQLTDQEFATAKAATLKKQEPVGASGRLGRFIRLRAILFLLLFLLLVLALGAGAWWVQKRVQSLTAQLNQATAENTKLKTEYGVDSDVVTLIADETMVPVPVSVASSQPVAAEPPLFALADIFRPGLGTALNKLASPPVRAPAPAGEGTPTYTPHITRWIVAGRVTPYIAPNEDTQVGYAYINVKTNAVEVHQPQPVRVLLSQMQAQGAR